MNKLWLFVKTKFLTMKFLAFGIIGVVNTGIHLLAYALFYGFIETASPQLGDALFAGSSNTVAFIAASVFSYFANALFTFKPKHRNSMQFSLVMLVFLVRWGVSTVLTMGFDYLAKAWLGLNYDVVPWTKLLAPFFASALLIPIAYFALGWVFQKTDREKIVS
jgi:putative flippase GtrA